MVVRAVWGETLTYGSSEEKLVRAYLSKWQRVCKTSNYPFIGNDIKIQKNQYITIVKNKSGFFMKNWIKQPLFSRFSFGFRPNLSAHNALNLIKN